MEDLEKSKESGSKVSIFQKFNTIFTFAILIISRAANVFHVMVLGRLVRYLACRYAIDNTIVTTLTIKDKEDLCENYNDNWTVYFHLIVYAGSMLGAQLLNYLREILFSWLCVHAEPKIAL